MYIEDFIDTQYNTLATNFRGAFTFEEFKRLQHRLKGLYGVVIFKQKPHITANKFDEDFLKNDNNDIVQRTEDPQECLIMPISMHNQYIKVESYNIDKYRKYIKYQLNNPKHEKFWHIITIYY